jgi:hypothetical protein
MYVITAITVVILFSDILTSWISSWSLFCGQQPIRRVRMSCHGISVKSFNFPFSHCAPGPLAPLKFSHAQLTPVSASAPTVPSACDSAPSLQWLMPSLSLARQAHHCLSHTPVIPVTCKQILFYGILVCFWFFIFYLLYLFLKYILTLHFVSGPDPKVWTE